MARLLSSLCKQCDLFCKRSRAFMSKSATPDATVQQLHEQGQQLRAKLRAKHASLLDQSDGAAANPNPNPNPNHNPNPNPNPNQARRSPAT